MSHDDYVAAYDAISQRCVAEAKNLKEKIDIDVCG